MALIFCYLQKGTLSIRRPTDFNWSELDFQSVESAEGIMYERFAKSRIEEAFSDTRVVLISGPRQSCKTTVATYIAAANDDPVGFLRGMDRGVIDEIQRAPDFIDQLRTTDAINHLQKIPIFRLGNAL